MSVEFCPCGFEGWDHALHSVEWHRAHRDHHLDVFPDVDQGTVDNLAMFVDRAAKLSGAGAV